MVQAQMQHNLKLQSMLDSQFAQARPSQIVEAAAMTTTAETFTTSSHPSYEFVPPARKAVPVAPPPNVNMPPTPKAPVVFTPQNVETPEAEIIYHDPKYRVRIHVKKESDVARSTNNERPPEGAAASKRSGIPSTGKIGSAAPANRYSPTELGPDEMDYFEPGDGYVPDGQDPGDGGDDDGGNGGGGPPTPPDPHNKHNKPEGDQNNKLPRKKKGGSGPPDVMMGMVMIQMMMMMRSSDVEWSSFLVVSLTKKRWQAQSQGGWHYQDPSISFGRDLS